MSIGLFRDVIIIVFGIVGTVTLVMLAIIIASLFRRMRTTQELIQSTLATLQSSSEVVKPVLEVVALIQGIRKGIDIVNSFFESRENRERR
ncbi:MAG: hypothetical protein HY670_02120 [Chloroflexi bacterium]|nr:hypothetical protein [Chloroflexota bacterium]